MDFATVSLMLVASLLHAAWHSRIKSSSDQVVGLAGMGLVAAVAAIPFAALLPALSLTAWVVIGASVVLHAGYKLCLAIAYDQGDLGQAFPMSRGAVPLFATLIGLVTIGQTPTLAQFMGISLVCVGLLALTIDTMSKYPWRLIVSAAGAGFTVAGYTVLDAYGASRADHWASFAAWLIIADNFTFLAIARIYRGRSLWISLVRTKLSAIISGMLGLASFSVFLWALSRHPVGIISTLREISVLFAVLLGVCFHGERLSLPRLCGATLILGGLIRIAA